MLAGVGCFPESQHCISITGLRYWNASFTESGLFDNTQRSAERNAGTGRGYHVPCLEAPLRMMLCAVSQIDARGGGGTGYFVMLCPGWT